MSYDTKPQINHTFIWHSVEHDHLLTSIRNGRVRIYGHNNPRLTLKRIAQLENIVKQFKLISHYYLAKEYNPEHRIVKWSTNYKYMINY